MMSLNPYLILGLLGAYLATFIAGGVLGWHEKSIRVPSLLDKQQIADQQACASAQAKTQEANDALQKDRDLIAAKLAALKLQHPTTCVPTACSPHVSGSGAGHAGQNGAGINTDWLRDYAAEAESYRSQLVICKQFLDSERALVQ